MTDERARAHGAHAVSATAATEAMTDLEYKSIRLCVARAVVEAGGTAELVKDILAPLAALRLRVASHEAGLAVLRREAEAREREIEKMRRVVSAAQSLRKWMPDSVEPGPLGPQDPHSWFVYEVDEYEREDGTEPRREQ